MHIYFHSVSEWESRCISFSTAFTVIRVCVCVLGRVVFHMPDWLHHVLSAGRILFKKTLEAYMDQYLQYKLDQILQEHRLISLITLLRGLFVKLFPSNSRKNLPLFSVLHRICRCDILAFLYCLSLSTALSLPSLTFTVTFFVCFSVCWWNANTSYVFGQVTDRMDVIW